MATGNGNRLSISSRELRLATGLVLAAFITSHLLNHALGLVSLDAMEAYRRIHSGVWQTVPGQILLYASFLTHFVLALVALYRRRHLRMTAGEAVRLAFGLLMPLLLLDHWIGARLVPLLFGYDATYPYVLSFLWLDPVKAWQQTALIVIVWTHLAIGLYFWLRLKPWYNRFAAGFHALIAVIPLLGWLGFARAGMDVAVLARDPAWLAEVRAGLWRASEEDMSGVLQILPLSIAVYLAIVAAIFVARYVRRLYRTRHGIVRIRYPGGRESVNPLGLSILEASQMAGIPHASVCGGRGRCTTCRVQIVEGLGELEPPSELEEKALHRIEAPADVRLACQTRPRRDVMVMPLLPANATARDGRRPGGLQGQERPVAILFVDIRGSTRLGEERLPYDVVFILNQFFAEMADALRVTNGHYAQFAGDGLMALYGVSSGVEQACRDAIAGAVEMHRRVRELNRTIERELGRGLRIGVGVHSGDAIVGTMGPPTSPNLSAIGDSVNVAARLEGLTKDYGCGIIVSVETAARAGIDLSAFPRHEAELRGRDDRIEVYALPDTADLPELAAGQAAAGGKPA